MMTRQTVTRRTILKGVTAASALVAAPAYLRHATAATPIKIGIPTVITGGYALLGSQVIRTCKLVKKMTDAKGGLLGQPVEFFYQDTQGDPATCVRKCQELVERDNCHILSGVIVSSEAAAMLPKLEEWNAIFISHGNGDGRLTAELFVPRFFRANTSAPMGARALALYLKDAPEKKFIAIASDAAWGRSSNAAFDRSVPLLREALEKAGRDPSTFPISKRVFLSVDERPEVARAELHRWFTVVYRNPEGTDASGIHGTPEQVRERLEELVAAGANHLLLNPVARYSEQLEVLASVVGLS